ncbi:hypothetical protein [Paraburkholderia unamae]|uniref:Uncharacterized protein n=1 Tax=Paraburkholderia unamae TaxID=219649 RepID=A0ABX5KLW4_9BURK|nr:hypothetical protein [Paraburkholderia unamae]PVX80020.1 hypothetical protein C7402_112207 [Paraburkholderia unamae]
MNKRRIHAPAALPGQMALNFEVFSVAPVAADCDTNARNPLDSAVRASLAALMDSATGKGLSRERLADRLTEQLGRPVTKAHLDQWAAPSQSDRRVPVDAWMALMSICDDVGPLEWMALHFDRRVLTVDEALCAELGAMAVLDRHIKAKSRAIEGQMDEKVLGQLLHRIRRNAK